MDTRAHQRFLDYRERFGYFAKEGNFKLLTYEEFVKADAEQRLLESKAEARDDEEEARFVELNQFLFRD
jgi:hypothetical protein